MNKQVIIEQLRTNYTQFIQLNLDLSKEDYLCEINGKWSAGQHLDHMLRAVQPVTLAFGLPHFLLRVIFGKANRPSRDFDGLVKKYQAILASGGRASGRFVPPKAVWEKRTHLGTKLNRQVEKLISNIQDCSESKLDELILPHPLLGKLTFREMLFFTIYHASHHQKSIENIQV